jgi:hypothetical protein
LVKFEKFLPRPQGPRGAGIVKFKIFMFPFTHRCFVPKLVEIGAAVSEKKLKMFKC